MSRKRKCGGAKATSLAQRLSQFFRHQLGNRSPHAVPRHTIMARQGHV